jgi:hypothetical protein
MAFFKYDQSPVTIKGGPTYTPIKGKPVRAMNRRQRYDVVENANNSIVHGWGKATINGKKITGFYFMATTGSAEGVAWNGGMNVYRLPDAQNEYFADESRVDLKIQAMIRRIAGRYVGQKAAIRKM